MESALENLIDELVLINKDALNKGLLTADQSVLVIQWFCERRSKTNIKDARERRIKRASNRYRNIDRVIKEIRTLCGL